MAVLRTGVHALTFQSIASVLVPSVIIHQARSPWRVQSTPAIHSTSSAWRPPHVQRKAGPPCEQVRRGLYSPACSPTCTGPCTSLARRRCRARVRVPWGRGGWVRVPWGRGGEASPRTLIRHQHRSGTRSSKRSLLPAWVWRHLHLPCPAVPAPAGPGCGGIYVAPPRLRTGRPLCRQLDEALPKVHGRRRGRALASSRRRPSLTLNE